MTDLVKRGQKAMFKLTACFKSAVPGYNTNVHLFDHVVKPVMMYASEIWGPERFATHRSLFNLLMHDVLEKGHLKQLRNILGVSKKSPKIAVYGETGRFPLLVEAITNSVKYFYRLNNLSRDENVILCDAFLEGQKLTTKNTWYNNMKCIMHKCSISPSLETANLSMIIKTVKNYLQNEFIKGWKSDLFNDTRSKGHGNKLRMYRTFKTTFVKESYLNDCTIKKHRQAFARLRLGAHRLQIEVDRYTTKNRIPPECRLCQICNSGVCEDEFHFIMKCTKYDLQRNMLFDHITDKYPFFISLSDETKFIWLMANADEKVIEPFVSFVYSSFLIGGK